MSAETMISGINGLDLTPGGVVVVGTGAEMAEVVRDLLLNPEKRRSIKTKARETVESRFDWDAIARGKPGCMRR